MNRLKDVADGKCTALCAELDGEPVGYISVYPNAIGGAFGGRGWPEIIDFGVLEKVRKRGVGTALMDAAEHIAADDADHVYLGVWYGERIWPQYEDCCNDDDLVLYLHKRLK